ncbi:MAG: phosphoserine transaminase [Phycisphaerales bacterium]|nr:phosphoserine transaminase [Phycisphaerales bacterium]
MSLADSTLNFSAGPAILPQPVLEQAQADIRDLHGTGIGAMEHSHRGAAFTRVIEEARADCRAVGSIPDDFEILFLQGGASSMFAFLPMNLLPADRCADYIHTGAWTKKAIADAERLGDIRTIWDGTSCGFNHLPQNDELQHSDDPRYTYYCSNNTIYGTMWPTPPTSRGWLINDASSEMFSRPIDWTCHDVVYAGAQKNLGPAGVTLLIIRRELLEEANQSLPSMFRFDLHAKNGSCLNTPPTFGIHVMGLVFKWILDQGGLDAMSIHNESKANVLYDAIDHSGGFYTGHAHPNCRSTMNVTFTCPNPELDAAFLDKALASGMQNLKGHRSIGGLRASIYNAFPVEGCHRLAALMDEFAQQHG